MVDLSITPRGGSAFREKREFALNKDNEGEWPDAPFVFGDLYVSVVKDPQRGGPILKVANHGVLDKHGEQTSFLKVYIGADGRTKVPINPKHSSAASMAALTKTKTPKTSKTPHAELKRKRGQPLDDPVEEAKRLERLAKAKAGRERRKLEKAAEVKGEEPSVHE